MAKQVRVELNSAGISALLNSPEVEALVKSEAQAIADRAGEGFKASSLKASSRYIAFAMTTNHNSIVEESENKSLSRAVIPHG